jgi:predicted DNA-binding transcriptional regulator YafY
MKSTTPIKLERLIRLDELFRQQAAKRYTVTSLGKELEVIERTVRNDLDFLIDRYHAPIEYTKIKGWHYTDLNWNLPTIPLGEGEFFALTLGARMLEGFAGAAYSLQLRSAIRRLGERLPETTWVNLQQVAFLTQEIISVLFCQNSAFPPRSRSLVVSKFSIPIQ